jgi:hypothetical protein
VQLHVQTRTSTQARSHAQKFFVKLDRKKIDLQSFLDSLDFSNLINMAPDLLEFEEEDDIADQKILGKRTVPAVSV